MIFTMLGTRLTVSCRLRLLTGIIGRVRLATTGARTCYTLTSVMSTRLVVMFVMVVSLSVVLLHLLANWWERGED